MTCEHKRLKHGYEKTYDVQWCLDCGVITHASDGLIGPGMHKRADWSDWINVNLEAWSCRNEAHDGKRCSHWCGGATCPASIRSVATTTKNDPIQPAHRALLRQYESITELESRLAAATDRITTLTEERDEARAERDALLRIKEAADVLYSEAEEYDLPDGLGMGASQQYWDDLANALFPDDSGAVIQADLGKVQTAVDRAWEAFNEEINKPEFLPCGHHHSLLLVNAETGEKMYCELCDCISRRNDAERMEQEAVADAERYRLVRRGQHWSVINGIGDTLRAEALDAAIDAARKEPT